MGPGADVEAGMRTVRQSLNAIPFPGGFMETETEFLEALERDAVRRVEGPRWGSVVSETRVERDNDDLLLQLRECRFSPADCGPDAGSGAKVVGGDSLLGQTKAVAAKEQQKLGNSNGAKLVPDEGREGKPNTRNSCGGSGSKGGGNKDATATGSHRDSYASDCDDDCDEPTRSQRGFLRLHRRVEWFMHFFIESCSCIERDGRWRVLLPWIVRKQPKPDRNERKSEGGGGAKEKTRSRSSALQHKAAATTDVSAAADGAVAATTTGPYADCFLAGLATVYEFFALPKCRRRISQFMIFPHMQKMGECDGGKV
eukprot:GHVU01223001.1.p1 GENE.GHVU01223001.1~~GHVU01223001.1.p1  ORF type:complete len:324 (-),score=45.40 GHVU01223001.1:86-1024(-)